MVGKRKLAREDWADAALEALCDGGVAAIAVEPIAAKLGTTKGSFYWHFANRDALVEAAVRRWAEQDTEALIALLDGIADPARRLNDLFGLVFGAKDDDLAELALLAHAGDPVIGPLLAEVTARRVEFIVRCFREMGCPETEANHRGLLAYTAFIGLIQAQRASGGVLLGAAERPGYLEFLRGIITS
ncbi:TetR/AcrR family transcriptional regulator [Amycolatopsis pittospori]|uniref:TetR/AcrR family transcriptional regulator n=1 Tax=Amycolatopsis pittospori TaxID=2749434 RepID=UPI0015F0ED50|nr:TetR/AcrR family transcriptional regulator [Amycolatopsis pittospori]